ncbi:MAG TPA: hemerythrin domain-containing protein [Candidatus Binatia bacterium]|jgi:iron-sulfur cluster repair protein YtfE (RIC family)
MARHPSLIALSHDHHHGLALALRCRKQALGRLKPMGLSGLKERAAEFSTFFHQNLTRHFQAEEEILFPSMRAAIPESSALIDDLLADHARLRGFLPSLTEESGLSKHLFDAGDLLERHIRREERELFPLFEKHAAGIDAEKLGSEMGAILG